MGETVAFDSVSSGSNTSGGTTSLTASWTHTVAGNNTLVLIAFSSCGASTTSRTWTGTCSYAGESLSPYWSGYFNSASSTGLGQTWVFAKKNPSVGDSTVSITTSTGTSAVVRDIVGSSVSFRNTSGAGSTVSDYGSGSFSVGTTVPTRGLLFHAIGWGDTAGTTTTISSYNRTVAYNSGSRPYASVLTGYSTSTLFTGSTSNWWSTAVIPILSLSDDGQFFPFF